MSATDVTIAARLNALPPHDQSVVRAFWQAMRELGIPLHPDGKCPGADCCCEEMSYSVNLRACELLGVSP